MRPEALHPDMRGKAYMNEREAEDKALADFVNRMTAAQSLAGAFRAGFRAGALEQRDPEAEFDRGFKACQAALVAGQRYAGAPASSELGIELSKIRDRLNALERSINGVNVMHLLQRIDTLSDALNALESLANDKAEPFPPSTKYGALAARVDALESSINLETSLNGVNVSKLANRVLALETLSGAFRGA